MTWISRFVSSIEHGDRQPKSNVSHEHREFVSDLQPKLAFEIRLGAGRVVRQGRASRAIDVQANPGDKETIRLD